MVYLLHHHRLVFSHRRLILYCIFRYRRETWSPCALRSISVPVLITAMGAHYFIRDNEIHYEVFASKDKDFIVIEGATHGITPCVRCEQTPGQYSNSVKIFFDYVAKWVNARF